MGNESRKQGDAQALHNRVAHEDSVIEAYDRAGAHDLPASCLPEAPIRRAAMGIDDATMPLQILERLRRPIFFQIAGRGDQPAPAVGEPLHDQSIVRQRSMTNDDIEAIGYADGA